MKTMQNALVAIGANLGDPKATFARAVQLLEGFPEVNVTGVSSIYSTKPIGTHAGDAYLNAAATVQTTFSPWEFLQTLHSIEHQLGRVRSIHWGPRSCDLDLILFEQCVIHDERIQLPHPASFYRRFVIDPAVEIAGDWQHPEALCSMRTLQKRLQQRPLPIAFALDGFAWQHQNLTLECIEVPFDQAAVVFVAEEKTLEPEVWNHVRFPAGEDPSVVLDQVIAAVADEPEVVGALEW